MVDVLEHFAAVRPPRGQEQCACCEGDGVHSSRPCARCDGTGSVRKGSDAPFCPGHEADQPAPRRRHWRQASIRRASPEEYGKYVYPDYPKARTLPVLARYLRKHEPDYYAALHAHIGEHGVQEPVLLRYRDPRGTALKRPVVMSGHHRAAAAFEHGQDIPVGDYDDQDDWHAGTSDFGQQWWRQHHELKEQYTDPRRHEAAGPEDYGIGHRPMEIGAPVHDLTGEGPDADFDTTSYHPDDYLTHPQYNSDTIPPSRQDYEALAQMRRVKGKPDHLVDIYRASHHSAPHEMNTGDWVTLSKGYARQHADAEAGSDDPDARYVVHHARVPARHVRDAGSGGYREQGYWGPPIACCGHEKTAVLAEHPEYGPRPEYRPPEGASAEEQSAVFERNRAERNAWTTHVKRGLSLGHLSAPEAKGLNYYFGGHETDNQGDPKWRALPREMYHATTDLPSVRQHGLKTRDELSQHQGGHGLGGGEDDTISVTTDHELGRGILKSLHEFHDVVNGKYTPQQMWEHAKAGTGASRPFHEDLMHYWDRNWKHGDPVPRGVHDALHGVHRQNEMGATQQDMDAKGPGWRPAHGDEGWQTGHTPPRRAHAYWERDMTPDEHRENAADFYKKFAAFREYAGGREDPNFFGTDEKAFAAKDPGKFALLHVRPRPGAQGYPMGGMREWRTGTGDALQVHHYEQQHGGQLHEAAFRTGARRRMPMNEIMDLKSGDWGGRVGDHLDDIREKLSEDEDGGDELRRRMGLGMQPGDLVVNRGRLDDGHRRVLVAHELGWDSMAVRSGKWTPRRLEQEGARHLGGDPEDYGMSMRPDETADQLHDLGGHGTFPRDIYDTLHHYDPGGYNIQNYGTGHLSAIRRARGNPEKMVTVYRAAPALNPESRNAKKGEINHGDWVTLNRKYAETDARGVNEPNEHSFLPADHPRRAHIWSARVPAKHVRSGGGDLMEWGYWGEDKKDLPHISERCSHRNPFIKRERAPRQSRSFWDTDFAGKGHFGAKIPPAERTESVAHMLSHYKPYDFDTWGEVRDNIVWDHPEIRAFVDDVRRNGVRRPIPVDYEQDPPQVRNGHTRLLAAERAGVTHVPTRQHEGWLDPDDPGNEDDEPEPKEGPGSLHYETERLRSRGPDEHEAARVSNFTNWDDALRELRYRKRKEPLMHRGMAVELPPEVHSFVHDQMQSRDQQARAIVRHLAGQPLGMHWAADDERPSRHFAEWHKKNALPGSTKVILHAALPESAEHIETDPEKLREGGVLRHDSWSSEREIPMKEGAPVNIKAVTWYGYGNRKRTGHLWGEEHTAGQRGGLPDLEYYHVLQGREKGGYHAVAAAHEGQVIGHLTWGPGSKKIGQLWVHPQYRRHGVAEAIRQRALWVEPELRHHTDRTDAGDAWAQSVGGDVPEHLHDTTSADADRKGAWAARQFQQRLDSGHPTMKRLAVLPMPGYRNPHTRGDEWFHGTRAHPDELSEGGFTDPMEMDEGAYSQPESETEGTHWNALLGTHFTADHDIAREFALGEHSSGANSRGGEEPWRGESRNVLHARLGLRNPKVYASEHDMDHEAYEHEWAAGNHPSTHIPVGSNDEDERYEMEDMWNTADRLHRQYKNRKIPRSAMEGSVSSTSVPHPVRGQWINSHPDKWGIASRFRERLKAQGHDGIIYGNEYERSAHGGQANKSAIVFDPSRIQVTQHHGAYEDHLSPEEGEHQQARLPGQGQMELPFERHGAGRDISRIRLKHDPPVVSGHWEKDERGVPTSWVDTDPAQGHHMLTALAPNNRQVGWMHWDKGVVRRIDVGESWQHSGLGRRMWERANEITPGLSHSDNRTEEGQGFARAVGGPLPERVQDHPEWFRDAARRKPLQPDQEECWKCGVRDRKETFTKASPFAPVMGLAMECTDKDACRARREDRIQSEAATDWGEFHAKIPEEIHRGLYAPESHGVFSMPMSDEDIAHGLIAAHQEEHFPYQRDRHKLFGTHWTSDEGVARGFAEEHKRAHFEDDDQCPDHDEHSEATPVVFHAQRPQRHEIEDDPRRLGWQNVDDYTDPEHEVPIRHGAPVRITGVSWLTHTGLGPMWHRHDLREPAELRAEDRDSPGNPGEWNASLHTAAWQPTQRIFGPTYGLDHRLFDEHEQLRPAVRDAIMSRLGAVLGNVIGPDWHAVVTAWLAGSQASKWTGPDLEGNGDLDVLIGLSHSHARLVAPGLARLTDEEIEHRLNTVLRERFNQDGWGPPFDPGGSYDLTGYAIHAADIRAISPYAAYDLSDDRWAVQPPDLPQWSAEQFPQGKAVFQEGRALIGQIRAVLRLPDPFRTQEASRLWDYIHAGRSQDFSETGMGWQGTANVLEKMIDQASGNLVSRLKELRYNHAHGVYDGPVAGAQGEATQSRRGSAAQGRERHGASGYGLARQVKPGSAHA